MLIIRFLSIIIDVIDCNGDFGGSAFIDNCNNCVYEILDYLNVLLSPTTVVNLADST